MKKAINLLGQYHFPNETILYHKESDTLAVIQNASCIADAEHIFADYLNIECNGLFNPKLLDRRCKSHLKIIARFDLIGVVA